MMPRRALLGGATRVVIGVLGGLVGAMPSGASPATVVDLRTWSIAAAAAAVLLPVWRGCPAGPVPGMGAPDGCDVTGDCRTSAGSTP